MPPAAASVDKLRFLPSLSTSRSTFAPIFTLSTAPCLCSLPSLMKMVFSLLPCLRGSLHFLHTVCSFPSFALHFRDFWISECPSWIQSHRFVFIPHLTKSTMPSMQRIPALSLQSSARGRFSGNCMAIAYRWILSSSRLSSSLRFFFKSWLSLLLV